MFWKFNLITTSHIETLLNKENVTLKELMDEEDILQECKAQSKKLIEFLTRPNVMEELISLIIQEPSEDLDEKQRYKYSNIACELLTADVAQMNDALIAEESQLNKLYSYLESESPLNPLLASFFSKTLGLLLLRKTEAIYHFIEGKEDFVTLLLNHFGTSAIMDLSLKFLSCVENQETRLSISKWLNEHRLVQRLVAMINPSCTEDENGNASQALCDIIKLSREQMSLLQEKAHPDPLLETIESTEVVSDLLQNLFGTEKKETVLVSGISVLLSLLEFKKQGPAGQQQSPQNSNPQQTLLQGETAPQYFASLFFRSDNAEQMTQLDADRLQKGVAKVLAAVKPRTTEFLTLLKDPPQRPSLSTTVGVLDPPLGYTRLEVAHLINALISANNEEINSKLFELDALPILIDLFFKYTWNNFLHTQVEQAIDSILNNNPTIDEEGNKVHLLLDQLFSKCHIIERILDTWDANEQEQIQPGKHRRGYMGHLTKIANHIVQSTENSNNSELVNAKLKELPKDYHTRWETFTSETLVEINKKNHTPLVGGVPIPSSSEDEECVDFREIGFHQDTALQQVFPRSVQQAFSDYQMQQMTSSFVDQFGFNDDEFVETDEHLFHAHLDQLTRVNFQLPAEVNKRNEEFFEQVCREKVQTLDDADSDEDVWDDKEHDIGFSNTAKPQRQSTDDSEGANSSDSDEEGAKTDNVASSSDDVKMDVDHAETSWATTVEAVPVAMDTSSPWENSSTQSATSSDEGGWASFDNFSGFSAPAFDNVADTTTALSAPVAMETSEQPDSDSASQKYAVISNTIVTSSPEVNSSEQEVSSSVDKVPARVLENNSASPGESHPECFISTTTASLRSEVNEVTSPRPEEPESSYSFITSQSIPSGPADSTPSERCSDAVPVENGPQSVAEVAIEKKTVQTEDVESSDSVLSSPAPDSGAVQNGPV